MTAASARLNAAADSLIEHGFSPVLLAVSDLLRGVAAAAVLPVPAGTPEAAVLTDALAVADLILGATP